MSKFSVDWLNMREDADLRARDSSLLDYAQKFLTSQNAIDAEITVVDLGAGTGSTINAFSKLGSRWEEKLHWRLVDSNKDLLEEAVRRYEDSSYFQVFNLDLNKVLTLPLDGAKLITASALMDLVSAEFIDAFLEILQRICKQRPIGFYSALSYDGVISWTPRHFLDDDVLRIFNQHQRSDKGFGIALGAEANHYLEQKLESAGFKVLSADSPWMLSSSEANLVVKFVDGVAHAVEETLLLDSALLLEWVEYRKKNVSGGTCIVTHKDILALPLLKS